jgi:hypothetical protein
MVQSRDSADKLRQARRHVAEAEKRVAAQRDLIERLTQHGDSERTISTARKVLDTFERTLDAMRQHLSIEEGEQRGSSR